MKTKDWTQLNLTESMCEELAGWLVLPAMICDVQEMNTAAVNHRKKEVRRIAVFMLNEQGSMLIHHSRLRDLAKKLHSLHGEERQHADLLAVLKEAEIAMQGAGNVRGNRAAEERYAETQLRVRQAIARAESRPE